MQLEVPDNHVSETTVPFRYHLGFPCILHSALKSLGSKE